MIIVFYALISNATLIWTANDSFHALLCSMLFLSYFRHANVAFCANKSRMRFVKPRVRKGTRPLTFDANQRRIFRFSPNDPKTGIYDTR